MTKLKSIHSRLAILRKVAKILELPKGSYTIRACMGGPALPGEAILHGDSIYISLDEAPTSTAYNCFRSFSYARYCQGQRDYTGGRNRPLTCHEPGYIAAVARRAMDERI